MEDEMRISINTDNKKVAIIDREKVTLFYNFDEENFRFPLFSEFGWTYLNR
jgi:hypothetical protein